MFRTTPICFRLMRRITNVRFPEPISKSSEASLWSVLFDDHDILRSIEPMEGRSEISGESWEGDWLGPMGVDIQINGGLGLTFSEITSKDLPTLFELLKTLWADGVEAICPTLVSCEPSQLRESLQVLQVARRANLYNSCQLLGAHLEGPFISRHRHGAHLLDYLCAPSVSALDQRISGFEKEIAVVTLAPELDGSGAVIRRLLDLGVVVSLGHCEASQNQCKLAFAQGVTMITHTFNAMPGLLHRAPGPVGAAIEHGGISMGLIADGVHVHPSMAVILQRLVSGELFLVSDALAPYGLLNGKNRWMWDKRLISVDHGTCRLEDGTLAGSTIGLLDGCKRLANWSGEPSASIWAGTCAPRRALNKMVNHHADLIGKSMKNLLRWDWDSASAELCWHRAV